MKVLVAVEINPKDVLDCMGCELYKFLHFPVIKPGQSFAFCLLFQVYLKMKKQKGLATKIGRCKKCIDSEITTSAAGRERGVG